MIEAFPLCWPIGYPRTESHRRRDANFRCSMASARDGAIREIKLLGGRDVIISTNLPVRLDGLPFANAALHGRDPGVAVYFVRRGKQFCFKCDAWRRVEHNMRAIEKTIEALRGISRWETGDMMEAAFRGFEALPAPQANRQWWEVLECKPDASMDVRRAQYMRLRSKTHPDKGGTDAAFRAVQKAWEQAAEA